MVYEDDKGFEIEQNDDIYDISDIKDSQRYGSLEILKYITIGINMNTYYFKLYVGRYFLGEK